MEGAKRSEAVIKVKKVSFVQGNKLSQAFGDKRTLGDVSPP